MSNESSARHYTAAFPGKYIQGAGAIRALPELMHRLGNNGMILASPTANKTILPSYLNSTTLQPFLVEEFGGECSRKETDRLLEITRTRNIGVVAGMGGGKTLDTAKIVADKAGIPVIIIPTIASTDAPCSGCAVVYSEEGVFESVYYQRMILGGACGHRILASARCGSCFRMETPWQHGRGAFLWSAPVPRTIVAVSAPWPDWDCQTLHETHPGVWCRCETSQRATNYHPGPQPHYETNILLSGIGFESSGWLQPTPFTTAHRTRRNPCFYHGEKWLSASSPASTSPVPFPPKWTRSMPSAKIGLPTTFGALAS